MTGRPDYDAGDLVACVDGKTMRGKVYRALKLLPPSASDGWSVVLEGHPTEPEYRGWVALCFRRIDPKPPEFFTGTVSADAGERVVV